MSYSGSTSDEMTGWDIKFTEKISGYGQQTCLVVGQYQLK